MNETIKTLHQHRTYRQFVPDVTIPAADINAILQAAQQAPSWMNGQHYAIVRITNRDLRAEIARLQPKNPQILTASEFWVFVGDMYRVAVAGEAYDGTGSALAGAETLMTIVTDSALAAENALIAAESLGYAGCFIGGIRSVAKEMIALLQLPARTFPLFGLCFGQPAVAMPVKPRLPSAAVVFENHYDHQQAEHLAQYEQTMLAFGEAREVLPWREKFARYYSRNDGRDNEDLLRAQKLL